MPRTSVPDAEWVKFFAALRGGMSRHAAARASGIPYNTVNRLFQSPHRSSGQRFLNAYLADNVPDPNDVHKLCTPARKALADFALFRRRYLGRISTPWQTQAALEMARRVETPEKEYVVVNAPPGSGKSTLFTCDIPLWLICRNRALRIMIGSRTEKQAKNYTARIRRNLERTQPVRADPDEVARGIAVDAVACLVHDYGRFKPLRSDLWRIEEFVVAQHGDVAAEDKEPSFSAYGKDSGFLGGRYDVVIWDDLVDRKTTRTAEAREDLVRWWETEAETRVEPGGLFVLQGQRMSGDDLYRYALDKTVHLTDESGEDADPDETEKERQYAHIVFKAHYPELCRPPDTHRRDAPAYPKGCLLDPYRLTWRLLETVRKNKAERFAVLYQQEDADPTGVLVRPVWIEGGIDADTGHQHMGCWDLDRRAGVLPAGLASRNTFNVVTADPSPTRFWSVQNWLWDAETQFHYLIDHLRDKMDAPEFLDWNHDRGAWTGLLEEWWQRSYQQGKPITHVIVERNAAQRFMLQYEHVRRWSAARSVSIVPHDTYSNRSDPDLGVPSLAPHYAFGRVRFPGADRISRAVALPLYREVTHYPDIGTDDAVMAHWFLVWNAPRLFMAKPEKPYSFTRPSWVRERNRLRVIAS